MRKALKEKSVIAGTLNCLNGNQITAIYTVEKFLGAGGSGLVYLCSDDSNKKYALKELYPKELEYMLKRIDDRVEYSAFAPEDVKASFEWYKQNLIRENQLCKQISSIRNLENNDPFFLDCKGILVINETTIYSVYETFYGFSLEEYIAVNKEKGNLNSIEYLSRILGIIAIIAKKTTLLHCQNILHLDISPSNILLVDYGAGLINSKDSDTPCLLDFGSAYKKDEETSINHRFSASEGYSAPEIVAKCQGLGEEYGVDESADTYSMVAILYSALMGETFDDPLCLYIHKQDNILSAFPNEVGRALAEIFTKGLHVEPWERFGSAEALANELLRIRALVSNENQDILAALSSIDKSLQSSLQKTEVNINTYTSGQTEIIKKHISLVAIISVMAVLLTAIIIIVLAPWNHTNTNIPNESNKIDTTIPSLLMSKPKIENGSVEFTIYIQDETELEIVEIYPSDISTFGFIADIEILGNGATRIIRLTNLKNIIGKCKITVNAGVGQDAAGNKSVQISSDEFSIDTSRPTITISAASITEILNGDTISYTVSVNDNNLVTYFGLHENSIEMIGFSADIEIIEISDYSRKIVFSNVLSTDTSIQKYFKLSSSIAKDGWGNETKEKTSPAFQMKKTENSN